MYFCIKRQCMAEVINAPVRLTEGAIAELRRLMAEPGFDFNQVLRIGVKGGGCSGMTYVLGFDQKQDGDEFFEVEGIPCVMSASHGIYLMGMDVDFQDGLNSRGFTFTNPNASKTCGCGTSFAV
jgi:iron-sulfur cluster assembly accessory protein